MGAGLGQWAGPVGPRPREGGGVFHLFLLALGFSFSVLYFLFCFVFCFLLTFNRF